MTRPLSVERASEIIGSIYDCVLDPANWDRVLSQICHELELDNAVLGVLRLPEGITLYQTAVGVTSELAARADDYGEDIIAIWGGQQRIQQYPLDEPVIQSEAIGQQAMQANRWFREQVAPRGLIDAVAFGIVRELNALGNVVFGRHGTYGPIDDQVLSGLRLLAPHFRRAITISNLFEMRAIETAAFRSALDAVPVGVVIVDETLRILHANAAAETMIISGSPLRPDRGLLGLNDNSAEALLQEVVARAVRDEMTIGQKGIGVPVTGATGEAFVMHVLPLRRGVKRPGLVANAAAAIFISAAARPLRMPMDAIALLYDLTPAEIRIFQLVCDGMAPEAIASQIGIALSTVRTHLNHIFEKTGCRRQADLVRLAAGLSL